MTVMHFFSKHEPTTGWVGLGSGSTFVGSISAKNYCRATNQTNVLKNGLKQVLQEITVFSVFFLTMNVYLILDKLAVKIQCGELTMKFNVKDISCSELSNIF